MKQPETSKRDAWLLAHRRPAGPLGKRVAQAMNLHHQPLRRWGLADFSLPAGARIVEAGCGGGMTAWDLLSSRADYGLVGFDLSEEMACFSRRINSASVAAGRTAFLAADVTHLPFPDAIFDGAVAFETAYFWPDPAAGAAELGRVLRPGGSFLIVNELYRHPGLTEEENRVAELLGMDLHTPREYLDLLKKAGLEPGKPRFHPDHPWIALPARRKPGAG